MTVFAARRVRRSPHSETEEDVMTTKSLSATATKITAAAALAIGLFTVPAAAESNTYHWNQPSYDYRHDNTHSRYHRWTPPAREWHPPYQRSWEYRIQPFSQVRRELRRYGYRHINRVGMRHGDYIVRAVNSRGYRVQLRVDGRTLRIMNWRYV
jgi:hypothetical protein